MAINDQGVWYIENNIAKYNLKKIKKEDLDDYAQKPVIDLEIDEPLYGGTFVDLNTSKNIIKNGRIFAPIDDEYYVVVFAANSAPNVTVENDHLIQYTFDPIKVVYTIFMLNLMLIINNRLIVWYIGAIVLIFILSSTGLLRYIFVNYFGLNKWSSGIGINFSINFIFNF